MADDRFMDVPSIKRSSMPTLAGSLTSHSKVHLKYCEKTKRRAENSLMKNGRGEAICQIRAGLFAQTSGKAKGMTESTHLKQQGIFYGFWYVKTVTQKKIRNKR